MLIHLNGLRKLTLFLVEAGVLFLFLAQLAGGFEEGLEVILVALIFEKVDLGEELLFLLF